MVKNNEKILLGKVLYGIFFAILVPLFLFFWAASLDKAKSVNLPAPDWPIFALVIAVGALLVIKGMRDLLVLGGGLPMNAFPPKKFVAKGIYTWFAHPIYLGTGLVAFGAALLFKSPAGLYIVAPVFVLAMISLVNGYEHFSLIKFFGSATSQHHPIFSLSSDTTQSRFLIGFVIFILASLYFSVSFYLLGFNFKADMSVFCLAIGLILVLSLNYAKVWDNLRNFSEKVANSRKDYIFFGGKFRIISHGFYSGLAGFVAVLIAGFVIGNNFAVLILISCAILGGALFAQLRWGSPSLMRPYGFWGGIIGGTIGMLLIRVSFGVPLYQTMLAAALSVPPAQAVGRLRCLEQGCCHGITTSQTLGIRVWQDQSRVVMLSDLKGKPIHATQLYSILFNLWLALLLFAMWYSQKFSAPLVIGMYFILTGIERFTEDAYRGEKQTRMSWGLQENQYIAIGALLIGVIISLMPFPASIPALGRKDLNLLGTALVGGIFTAFAMSMDFPKSKLKFSRLSG
jgi:phosphatidylglycerol:prolipoprotein diacylglycerol transferase